MVTAYWTVAGITFLIILSAFLRDRATRKVSLKAWAFIAIATLLWPVTLPFIISSKLRADQAKQTVGKDQTNQAKDQVSQVKEQQTSLLTTLQAAPAGDS